MRLVGEVDVFIFYNFMFAVLFRLSAQYARPFKLCIANGYGKRELERGLCGCFCRCRGISPRDVRTARLCDSIRTAFGAYALLAYAPHIMLKTKMDCHLEHHHVKLGNREVIVIRHNET